MIQTLLIPLLCCIILIIILLAILNKRNKILKKVVLEKHNLEVLRKEELNKYFREEWNRQEGFLQQQYRYREKELDSKREALENEYKNLEQELKSNYTISKTELDGIINQLNTELWLKEKRYKEVNQDLETYKKGKIEEIDSAAAEYEKHRLLVAENSINSYRDLLTSILEDELTAMNITRKEALANLATIQSELEEERTRRAAINEEILRQRRVEEQQDFYRIQLDEGDELDIKVLRSIIPRLKHPEAINKVIWTGYYQKPLVELRKRLLPNGDISGVYKITRLRSGEIYIGQSTSIDKRFQEHVKSALGVGNLASSLLHRTMSADRPENFTFEILEETPKEKLRERESYYIDFYDSKTYGLNSVSGDKQK